MPAELRALIVDDEAPARTALHSALVDFPFVTVVGEAENGYEAVKLVHELHPDLLFLDIQMPRLDGFDVVELLGQDLPAVIFVTAHDEYALQAFEARAVDYLLKPVKGERLAVALERVRSLAQAAPGAVAGLLTAHQETGAPLSRLLVRDRDKVFVIPVEEILYIEAEDDYVAIHTADASHLKYERMAVLEKLLDPGLFCRIHRSCIVNIACLKRIEPYSKDSRIAVLKNGKTLPVSRAGHARLLELF